MDQLDGDKQAYDLKLRPSLMIGAITALQDAGVEPDVWKIESLDRREDCERIVAAARRQGRDKVGCIILGRGEDDSRVREMAHDGGERSGLHRFRGWAHDVLGPTGPLPRWRDHAQ